MTTTKPINPAQLQREALALAAGHVELTVLGPAPDATGICPASATLLCADAPNSSVTSEPCADCQQAYAAHTAAPNPVPPNAVMVVVQALATIPSTDPGYNVAQTVLSHLQQAGL